MLYNDTIIRQRTTKMGKGQINMFKTSIERDISYASDADSYASSKVQNYLINHHLAIAPVTIRDLQHLLEVI